MIFRKGKKCWSVIGQNKIFNFLKFLGQVLLIIGTIAMAVFTAWMAYETRSLAQLGLRPYISPKDIKYSWIDKTGTEIRTYTILDEPINNKTVDINNVQGIRLTVKFSNSGKLPGNLKIKKLCGPNGQLFPDKEYIFLIPGSGESGWLLGLPLPLKRLNDRFFYDYDLETTYSDDFKFNRPLQFSVECDTQSVSCWFIKYEDHCK
jgi:hypothetical protein